MSERSERMNGDSSSRSTTNGSSSRTSRKSRTSRTHGHSDDTPVIFPLSPPSRDTREIYTLQSKGQLDVSEGSESRYSSQSAPTTSSSRDNAGGRVSTRTRTQLEDLEQKKLEVSRMLTPSKAVLRTPVIRRDSSKLRERDAKIRNPSPSLQPGAVHVPNSVGHLQQKKLEDISSDAKTRSPSSSLQPGAIRVQSGRTPIGHLEQKKIEDMSSDARTRSPSSLLHPGAVRTSGRTPVGHLEQRKLEDMSSDGRIRSPSSSLQPGAVRSSGRTPIGLLEQKKLEDMSSDGRTKSPSSSLQPGAVRVQSGRTPIGHLEQRKLEDMSSDGRIRSPSSSLQPGAVRSSGRTPIGHLEQKKLEDMSSGGWLEVPRAPFRQGSSSANDADMKIVRPSQSGRRRSSSKSRAQLDELEQAKLASMSSGSRGVVRATIRRGSSSLSDRDAKLAAASPGASNRVSVGARAQLDDLEQKKLAANPTSGAESHVRRTTPRKVSISELESEKIAAGGGKVSPNSSQCVRKISVSELEREKKIAAAGMNAREISHGRPTSQFAKSGKVLTDQTGRSIELDDEFARLHSGNVLGSHHSIEGDEAGLIAQPGAIAVYEGQYEGEDEHEHDYVNPDNFDGERAQAEQDDEDDGQNLFSQLQEAQTQSVNSLRSRESAGQSRLFPGVKKGSTWLPLALLILVTIGVIIGVIFAVRGGKGGDSPTAAAVLPGTLAPTVSPTTFAPTSFPTTSSPSRSSQPSDSPPEWIEQGRIEGAAFGMSVDLINDFLVFSNTSAIYAYERVNDEWSPTGQLVLGDLVQIADTKRILVRENIQMKVYDLVDDRWSQVGNDVATTVVADSIAISGDGSTIAFSVIVNPRRYLCRVYRLNGDQWTQYGKDIAETGANPFTNLPAGTVLTYDGNQVGVSVAEVGGVGTSVVLNAQAGSDPDCPSLDWFSILSSEKVFAGGPALALSREDPKIIATGGSSLVDLFDEDGNGVGERIKLSENAFVTPTVALSDDGKTLAYAWNKILQVTSVADIAIANSSIVPEFEFNIDSVSFSSDGRLAVGTPDGNMVQILEVAG